MPLLLGGDDKRDGIMPELYAISARYIADMRERQENDMTISGMSEGQKEVELYRFADDAAQCLEPGTEWHKDLYADLINLAAFAAALAREVRP